jgi:Chromate transporter
MATVDCCADLNFVAAMQGGHCSTDVGDEGGRFRKDLTTDAATNRAADGGRCAGSPLEVFRVFLKLGVSSFGGPIAHIGYFREEFVVRRRWLSEQTFVDLVALCQFLPGPASSQTGFSIGLVRAGYGWPRGQASLCRRRS